MISNVITLLSSLGPQISIMQIFERKALQVPINCKQYTPPFATPKFVQNRLSKRCRIDKHLTMQSRRLSNDKKTHRQIKICQFQDPN